jgi:hypothetical protein
LYLEITHKKVKKLGLTETVLGLRRGEGNSCKSGTSTIEERRHICFDVEITGTGQMQLYYFIVFKAVGLK